MTSGGDVESGGQNAHPTLAAGSENGESSYWITKTLNVYLRMSYGVAILPLYISNRQPIWPFHIRKSQDNEFSSVRERTS